MIKNYFKLMLGVAAISQIATAQTTYTFTTAGATGPTGPSQAMLVTSYGSFSDSVTVSGGIQSFTIPATGIYRIAATGAQGGYNGGYGAYIAGNFTLTAGTVLNILVGQQGTASNNGSNGSGGGGGGSFVSSPANVPYIIAGGGGGNGDGYNGLGNSTPCCLNGMEASITNNGNGTAPQTTGGTAGSNGGTSGNGASCAPGASAGGGAGFYGNGTLCNSGLASSSFTNGGGAGLNGGGISGDGGFGGGGGCYNSGTGERGGGGGGYSGGGGGTANTGYDAAGGGGGSYNNGASQTNSISTNTGDGLITITQIYGVIIEQTSDITCNGLSNAALSSTVGGGAPSYTYSWSTGATTSSISGLAAGVYTLSVTDAGSQVTSASYTITEPPVLTATISSQTNILCNGGNNGSVTITPSGGTSGYTYSWTPSGGTSATASNLTANNYTCTITDANSCTATTTITITEPAQLMASSTSGTILCNGGATTVTISATGGTTSYSGDGTMPNITAGSYTYTVTDANSCTATTIITVTEPTQLMASSTSGTILCNGGATTVTVSATGGTTSYTGDGTMSNVTAGSYTYTVTDANSCTATTIITVAEPNVLTVSQIAGTNVSCNGLSDGTATASVSGGSAVAYTYTWSPLNIHSQSVIGLSAANYTFTVMDNNGCTASATLSITQPNAIDVSLTVGGPLLTANNATATSYQWIDCNNANTPVSGATNQSYSITTSGTYAVIITEGSCADTSICTSAVNIGIAHYNSANNLQVYPNPFTNELTITSTAKTNALLFDVLGNKINEFALQNTTQTISLGDLAPGVYYLQVDAQKIKIIKQ